ncbi:hypothetical protein QBC44DRAFT_395465 [Cladorrhinum sp. PSN332]|nr:hypothetical protein QBC44DRAFT_395465 [Cladorrhinum sp. PSN332]
MDRPSFHKRVLCGVCCCFYFESECAIKRAKLVAREREAEKEANIVAFLNRPPWGEWKAKSSRRRVLAALPASGSETAGLTTISDLDGTSPERVPVIEITSPNTTRIIGSIKTVVTSLLFTANTTTPTMASSSSTTSSRRRPSPPILSDTPIPSQTLSLLLAKIDSCFSHARYAVAGLAALTVWGYTDASPSRVTVLTGYDSYESLRSWASTAGWYVYTEPRDVIAVPLTLGDGVEEWRGIVLKVLSEDEVGKVEIVMCRDQARVVGLSGMLELRLGAWLGMHSLPAEQKCEETVKDCERQVGWILRRLVGEPKNSNLSLSRENVPCLYVQRVWDGFLGREKELREMLEDLGVKAPGKFNRETRIIEERIWTGTREMRMVRAERDSPTGSNSDKSSLPSSQRPRR